MHKKQLFYVLGSLSLVGLPFIGLPSSAQPKQWGTQPAAKAKTVQQLKPKQAAAPTPNLEVVFKELRSSDGQVCISLFSGPNGFPKGGSPSDLLVTKCAPIVNKTAFLSFSDLKPGKYAITAFHDANSDNKMNKNSFGMPEEGFGFSNNPEIGFSAPSFNDTQFPVSGSKAVVPIQVRYLN
jgi:uncharacterized protein (DUF2141 family)